MRALTFCALPSGGRTNRSNRSTAAARTSPVLTDCSPGDPGAGRAVANGILTRYARRPRRSHDRRVDQSFDQLASSILDGKPATEDDALAVLRAHDDELIDLVAAAGRLRREHFGNTVKVNYLVNLKSGLCPENCSYCSQALGSTADILKYTWLKTDEALEQAAAGMRGGATRVCMVSSGRGPDRPRRRAGRRHGRRAEVRAPRRRGVRLPRPAQGRPGRAAPRGRRRRLQPQHQHRRVPPRHDRHDAHVRRPGRHRDQGQDRRAVALQRPDRRARRDRRAARARRCSRSATSTPTRSRSTS